MLNSGATLKRPQRGNSQPTPRAKQELGAFVRKLGGLGEDDTQVTQRVQRDGHADHDVPQASPGHLDQAADAQPTVELVFVDQAGHEAVLRFGLRAASLLIPSSILLSAGADMPLRMPAHLAADAVFDLCFRESCFESR